MKKSRTLYKPKQDKWVELFVNLFSKRKSGTKKSKKHSMFKQVKWVAD